MGVVIGVAAVVFVLAQLPAHARGLDRPQLDR